MPSVVIRTEMDGKEEILVEYFCDSSGCGNIADEIVGMRELGVTILACREHAASPGDGEYEWPAEWPYPPPPLPQ